MTTVGMAGRLRELFDSLERDWKALYSKYPSQAIFALGDKRVTQAIEKRFSQKAGVKDITLLPYSFQTGLNTLCFEFTTSPDAVSPAAADAFLVVLDGNCKVAGVIDPFDPAQPNAFMPPLPKEGEQPFVLHRPSMAEHLSFNDQELLPARVRRQEYFKKLAAGITDTAVSDIDIYGTTCNYTTRTPGDYWPDNNRVDDCGTPPILA